MHKTWLGLKNDYGLDFNSMQSLVSWVKVPCAFLGFDIRETLSIILTVFKNQERGCFYLLCDVGVKRVLFKDVEVITDH